MNNSLNIYSALDKNQTFREIFRKMQSAKDTILNTTMPNSLREIKLDELKSLISESITIISSGALTIERKKIDDSIITKISDAKIQRICIEINKTPDENVISLFSLIGECLKWTLWHKAKQKGSKLKEECTLKQILDEAESYYDDNAAKKFIAAFRDNLLKQYFDSIRHSDNFVPDSSMINNQIPLLEHLVKVSF